MLGHRRLTTFLAAAVVADTIPTMLNSAKLSLAANWPVGPTGRVKVSDGFVVDGANSANGFFVDSGEIVNGKPLFRLRSAGAVFKNGQCRYNGTNWEIGTEDENDYSPTGQAALGNEAFPWLADFSGGSITLTHPAVQQLASPSSAQGGVFVSGADDASVNAVYIVNPGGVGLVNGKSKYGVLGGDYSSDYANVYWDSDGVLTVLGHGPDAPCWFVNDPLGNGRVYYSTSAVATPDLASNWKNASDDSPASITVTNVTQGELDAGVTVAGAGDATANRILPFSLNEKGNRAWGLNGADSVNTDGSVWSTAGNTGAYSAPYNAASPWNAAPWTASAGAPAPTVSRNNVASEANWTNV